MESIQSLDSSDLLALLAVSWQLPFWRKSFEWNLKSLPSSNDHWDLLIEPCVRSGRLTQLSCRWIAVCGSTAVLTMGPIITYYYIFTTANLFISFCIKNLLEKVAASSTHCNARWRSLWRIFIKFRSAQSASDYQWHWSSDRENRRHFFDQFDKQIIIWNNYFNLLRFTAKEN